MCDTVARRSHSIRCSLPTRAMEAAHVTYINVLQQKAVFTKVYFLLVICDWKTNMYEFLSSIYMIRSHSNICCETLI